MKGLNRRHFHLVLSSDFIVANQIRKRLCLNPGQTDHTLQHTNTRFIMFIGEMLCSFGHL